MDVHYYSRTRKPESEQLGARYASKTEVLAASDKIWKTGWAVPVTLQSWMNRRTRATESFVHAPTRGGSHGRVPSAPQHSGAGECGGVSHRHPTERN